jgi:hypothetical protein
MAPNMKHAAYRATLAPTRQLHDDWERVARQYADAAGLERRFVYGLFEEQASLRLYEVGDWNEAQARAWSDCLAILERSAA